MLRIEAWIEISLREPVLLVTVRNLKKRTNEQLFQLEKMCALKEYSRDYIGIL